MICKSLLFLLLLGVLKTSDGYSSGAPSSACEDMVPQHHTPPQTSPFPYAVVLNKKEIKSGESVTVTITGTEAAKNFKGFFVQARVGDVAVGKFLKTKNVDLVNCGDSKEVSYFSYI